jgi:hypothetical protein
VGRPTVTKLGSASNNSQKHDPGKEYMRLAVSHLVQLDAPSVLEKVLAGQSEQHELMPSPTPANVPRLQSPSPNADAQLSKQ